MFATWNALLVLLSAITYASLVAADTVAITPSDQQCKICHSCRPPPKSIVSRLTMSDFSNHDYIEYSIAKGPPEKYIVHIDDIEEGRGYP